jgi:hypothetical protein
LVIGTRRAAGRPQTPAATAASRSCLVFGGISRPSDAVEFIRAKGVRVCNVAGNRESKAPGIGARVERFLRDVFRRLGHAEVG